MQFDVDFSLNNRNFKAKMGNIIEVGGGGTPCIVDQNYNPESENAQSGKAVAEAVIDKASKEEVKELCKGMELINSYTFTGEETSTHIVFSKDADGKDIKLDEVFIEINYGDSINFEATFSCYANEYSSKECMFYKSGAQSGRYFYFYGKRCGSEQWFTLVSQKVSSQPYNGVPYFSYAMSGVDYITRLRIVDGLNRAGVKISIYGRGAD